MVASGSPAVKESVCLRAIQQRLVSNVRVMQAVRCLDHRHTANRLKATVAHPSLGDCIYRCAPGLTNRLTLLKARLQMGDIEFAHVLQELLPKSSRSQLVS